jgi:hypothetical protein
VLPSGVSLLADLRSAGGAPAAAVA